MSLQETYRCTDDLPKQVPIFPLAGALLLPRAHLPLNIFEPRYLQMIDDAMRGDRIIAMVQPNTAEGIQAQGDANVKPSLYRTACAGRITSFSETGDNRFLISLTGICRLHLGVELEKQTPYRICQANFEAFADDLSPGRGEEEVDRDALLVAFRKFLDANGMQADWDEVNETPTEVLVNTLCVLSPYDAADKQAMLEAGTLKARCDTLIALTEMVLASHGPSRGTGGPGPTLQ
ncbi:MAG: LON peptidase substrate-binding domain-containing protein [Pseudomonadota bacterium]